MICIKSIRIVFLSIFKKSKMWFQCILGTPEITQCVKTDLVVMTLGDINIRERGVNHCMARYS